MFKNLSFKKIFSKKPSDKGSVERSPEKDWKIILLIFILVTIALGGLSAVLFLKINKGEIFTTVQNTEVSSDIVDRTLLDETLLRFDQKERMRNKLDTEKLTDPDPSI